MTISLKPNGSPDITGWTLGEQLQTLDGIKVGDVLLCVDHQFDAQNLVRITELGNNIVGADAIVYGYLCDEQDELKPRAGAGGRLSIWVHQLTGKREAFYRVSKDNRKELAARVARSAGRALEEIYPFGYRSGDSGP